MWKRERQGNEEKRGKERKISNSTLTALISDYQPLNFILTGMYLLFRDQAIE